MEDAKIFEEFLKLAQKHFRIEHGIEFYAWKLGIPAEELKRVIWTESNSTFSHWLAAMERSNVENHGAYHEI